MKKIISLFVFGISFVLATNGCEYFKTSQHKTFSITRIKRNEAMERTFAMIKPDAVAALSTGKIIDRIEQEGFTIVGMKKLHITLPQTEAFYAVHKERPFFGELTDFLSSGPIVVLALEKDNAIKAWRDLMGATNPAEAAEGTLRKEFGANIGNNATHGSDAPETAQVELAFFFPELEN